MALTDTGIAKAIKDARAKSARMEIADDGKGSEAGLMLRVSGDKQAWSVRVALVNGKRVRAPLGEYPGIGIAEAREAARKAKADGKRGIEISPVAVREAAKEAERLKTTVRECLDAYPFGDFVRLSILTAGRRDEVAEMRIEELDLDADGGAVWTLPSTRSKNGRAIRIPLAPGAVEIIRASIGNRPESKPPCPFVFSTTGNSPISGWNKFKTGLDRSINANRAKVAKERGSGAEEIEHWTLHDLRRSFATAAIDVLHLDPSVVDRCLNHVGASTSSTVARVYARTEMIDQRRAALTAWAGLIARKIGREADTSNVIRLPLNRAT